MSAGPILCQTHTAALILCATPKALLMPRKESPPAEGVGPGILYPAGRAKDRNSADQKRQNDFFEAQVLCGACCQFGHYLQKTRQCRQCGASWSDYEEKMTDADLAIQSIGEAMDEAPDTTRVRSGDPHPQSVQALGSKAHRRRFSDLSRFETTRVMRPWLRCHWRRQPARQSAAGTTGQARWLRARTPCNLAI